MGNKELFKTVLFGGFQKEEVWNYMQEVEAEIEGGRQVAERAQQEYAQQLEEENLMRQKLSSSFRMNRNARRSWNKKRMRWSRNLAHCKQKQKVCAQKKQNCRPS